MKTLRYLLLLVPVLLLSNCEERIVGEPVEKKIYGRMGYHSILDYRYMQYTGDSAVLIMRVEEIDASMRHYNNLSTYVGIQQVANSHSLPFETEIPIPIIDDSVFYIKHICRIDSVPSMSDTLVHTVYVHKSEVVNPRLDTVTVICERLDSIIVKTYYDDPKRFYWFPWWSVTL